MQRTTINHHLDQFVPEIATAQGLKLTPSHSRHSAWTIFGLGKMGYHERTEEEGHCEQFLLALRNAWSPQLPDNVFRLRFRDHTNPGWERVTADF